MKHTAPAASPLRRLAITAAVLALAAGAASSARAAVQYTLTDLGTLGGSYSCAYGINNSGQVVGYSYAAAYAQHAFLYSGGQMIDLGTLTGTQSRARGINDSGQIVGSVFTGAENYPFLYSGGTMTA